MSFKKWHKRAYKIWVVVSIFVMISLVGFIVAPFFLY